MKTLKLSIELIPSSSWGSNLRNVLKPKMWDEIRKKVYKSNNMRCAICQRSGKLQAHEIWKFDDKKRIQKLVDIIPLCFLCHMVKHIGFASLTGDNYTNDLTIKHFMTVNKVDRLEFQKHLKSAIKNFEDRSRFEWQLELSKLKDFE